MKNVLFITRLNQDENFIFIKVLSQVDGIRKNNYEVDLISHNSKLELLVNGRIKVRFKNIFHLHLNYFKVLLYVFRDKHYDIIYIRNPFIFGQKFLYKFIKKNKKKGAKIIFEYPTYPYKNEINDLKGKILLIYEFLWSLYQKKLIDLICYSGDELFFINRVKTRRLFNVVNTDNIPVISINTLRDLNFISVSACQNYHGLERFILGFRYFHYNKFNINVNLIIIGDGPYLEKYKEIVSKFNLEKYVNFFGRIDFTKLNPFYESANIGIGPLAMHRIGLTSGSPIKTSEYAARGLPFIISYDDYTFNNCDFVFKVPPDDTVINIEQIITWYLRNEFNPLEIRNYVSNYSWEYQYSNILHELYD